MIMFNIVINCSREAGESSRSTLHCLFFPMVTSFGDSIEEGGLVLSICKTNIWLIL